MAMNWLRTITDKRTELDGWRVVNVNQADNASRSLMGLRLTDDDVVVDLVEETDFPLTNNSLNGYDQIRQMIESCRA